VTASIVDTGPLIAFLNDRDQHYKWTVRQLSNITPPLLTCEAVLSEAFFLLRRHSEGTRALIKLLERGIVIVSFQLDKEYSRVGRLMLRYADVPMSLADACLVRMSEIIADCQILTLDSDFRIYRRNGRQVVPTVSPAV
jgi:predicted nucleic acid-binding protein